ncbi:hypothetical protein [Rubinisphaera sp.]|uniref:hypothetical protein n=1 Tax=Rubinisphaera sp. TaxID=2024857 RepID=UPI0025E3DDDD|nr:hypothetical protein [Rubinisphaera sp.]|tara:strand:+ start:2895 stop:3068 length:174 start_codon:yes stop_codon:yes gene_type:complete
MPNARHKLNAASIHGILIVAGTVAFFVQSWPFFWVLVAILLGTSYMSGEIRPQSPRK